MGQTKSRSMGGEALSPSEEKAHMKPRRCTDAFCLLILAVALAFLGYVQFYAWENGDMRRLYHGFDFMGNLCGVDQPTRPYVFYCRSPLEPLQLDLHHPICVSACPTTESTQSPCYQSHTVTRRETDPTTGSFEEVFEYAFANVQDYPSQPLAGMYCTPQDTALFEQLWSAMMGSGYERFVLEAWELRHGWAAILVGAGVAVALCYTYLLLVRLLAKCLVAAVLLVLMLSSTLVGCTMIGSALGHIDINQLQTPINNAGYGDSFLLPESATGSRDLDLYLGIGLLVLGGLVAVVVCCCRSQLEKAMDCIEVTTDCLMRLPNLLMTPILTLLGQLVLGTVLLAGFLHLVSVGEVQHRTLRELVPTGDLAPNVGGVFRDVTFNDYETGFVVYYVFMIFWILEIFAALAQFSIIYAIEVWYFAGGRNSCCQCSALLQGGMIGLFYHLGTLSVGAFLIATLRLARAILSLVAAQEKAQSGSTGRSSQNAVTGAVLGCCSCCLACFERFVKFMNKNAYMDVAMSSSNFCTAGRKAFKILSTNIPAVAVLNGMTTILSLCGVAAVTVGSAGLTYLMVTNMETFTDPASEHYVPKPLDLCVITGVIAAGISWVFMSLLDTVSDTILFCLVVDQDFSSGFLGGRTSETANHALPSLKEKTDKYSTAE